MPKRDYTTIRYNNIMQIRTTFPIEHGAEVENRNNISTTYRLHRHK